MKLAAQLVASRADLTLLVRENGVDLFLLSHSDALKMRMRM